MGTRLRSWRQKIKQHPVAGKFFWEGRPARGGMAGVEFVRAGGANATREERIN